MDAQDQLTTRKFREWCRKARKLWPLDKPVSVRRRALKGYCGYAYTCEDTRGRVERCVIVIDTSLCRQAAVDTLIHEWAHLVRGEYDTRGMPLHDDEFWTLYGSMYRAWHREK